MNLKKQKDIINKIFNSKIRFKKYMCKINHLQLKKENKEIYKINKFIKIN